MWHRAEHRFTKINCASDSGTLKSQRIDDGC
jgi:hypothetical protein